MADTLKVIVKRFDLILEEHGYQYVRTLGRNFDPQFMNAVGTASLPDHADGEVLEEVCGCYMFKEQVYQVAQVTVNVAADDPAAQEAEQTDPHGAAAVGDEVAVPPAERSESEPLADSEEVAEDEHLAGRADGAPRSGATEGLASGDAAGAKGPGEAGRDPEGDGQAGPEALPDGEAVGPGLPPGPEPGAEGHGPVDDPESPVDGAEVSAYRRPTFFRGVLSAFSRRADRMRGAPQTTDQAGVDEVSRQAGEAADGGEVSAQSERERLVADRGQVEQAGVDRSDRDTSDGGAKDSEGEEGPAVAESRLALSLGPTAASSGADDGHSEPGPMVPPLAETQQREGLPVVGSEENSGDGVDLGPESSSGAVVMGARASGEDLAAEAIEGCSEGEHGGASVDTSDGGAEDSEGEEGPAVAESRLAPSLGPTAASSGADDGHSEPGPMVPPLAETQQREGLPVVGSEENSGDGVDLGPESSSGAVVMGARASGEDLAAEAIEGCSEGEHGGASVDTSDGGAEDSEGEEGPAVAESRLAPSLGPTAASSGADDGHSEPGPMVPPLAETQQREGLPVVGTEENSGDGVDLGPESSSGAVAMGARASGEDLAAEAIEGCSEGEHGGASVDTSDGGAEDSEGEEGPAVAESRLAPSLGPTAASSGADDGHSEPGPMVPPLAETQQREGLPVVGTEENSGDGVDLGPESSSGAVAMGARASGEDLAAEAIEGCSEGEHGGASGLRPEGESRAKRLGSQLGQPEERSASGGLGGREVSES